uniref:Uncharacterized protein n=1 Tax=Triticum urartu TaxID=4572 RepID=A0A8R7K208_TRIUA
MAESHEVDRRGESFLLSLSSSRPPRRPPPKRVARKDRLRWKDFFRSLSRGSSSAARVAGPTCGVLKKRSSGRWLWLWRDDVYAQASERRCCCATGAAAKGDARGGELPRLLLLLQSAPLLAPAPARSRSAASTRRRSRRQGAQTPSAFAYGWSLHLIGPPLLAGSPGAHLRRGAVGLAEADRGRGTRRIRGACGGWVGSDCWSVRCSLDFCRLGWLARSRGRGRTGL